MSSDLYTGNAAQTDFTITYPYLSRDFVKVYVDDVLQTHNVDYTYISPTVIRFAVAPPAVTDNVLIQRVTSTAPLVDFVNGSGINAADLDTATQQSLHASEEATGVVGPAGPTGPAGAGGPVLLASGTETNIQRVFVPLTSGYSEYDIQLRNWMPVTGGVTLYMRFGASSGAGDWFDMEDTDYHYTFSTDRTDSNTQEYVNGTGGLFGYMADDISPTHPSKSYGIKFFPSTGSDYNSCHGVGHFSSNLNTWSNRLSRFSLTNHSLSARATHAVFYLSTGNFSTIEWEVKGIA